MRTILLDDEPYSLSYLEKLCLQIPSIEVEAAFHNAEQALEFLTEYPAELIISDIEMPGLSGIEAVQKLRAVRPNIGIIFVTGYEQYAFQAYKMEAVAYLLKPCSLEELASAANRAKRLIIPDKNIVVHTFGYFSVTINGVPLRFSNSKAKELLALLVDRNGGVVTMEQAVDVLWEDRIYDEAVKRLYRKSISYLHQIFDGTGFFISNRGSCHIVPCVAECDYFMILQSMEVAMNQYSGDYMLDYSWAEYTNGKIIQLVKWLPT